MEGAPHLACALGPAKWGSSPDPPVVISRMQCLYDVNPPSLYHGPPYHPSWAVWDPLTAQKWAEMHPETLHFTLSIL